MLKRQESSLSASRRQAAAAGTTPPPESHHAKAIGCMSGIIHLFSKYQNSKKRITFGKKQEKRKPPPSNGRSAIKTTKNSAEDDSSGAGRLMCAVKVLRSPTLPPEIRRSNAARSPENSRTPPSASLVARLMGLEDLGSAAKRPGLTPENTITEKRQRLMQALEKCNEDLEALKSIIKAVQTADVRLQPPLSPPPKQGHPGGGNGGSVTSVAAQPCMNTCTESGSESEKPNIPVDELSRSPVSTYCVVQNSTAGGMHTTHHRTPAATKKPGEEDEAISRLLTKSTIVESSLEMRRRAAAAAASPPWSSRAMVESVEEVCNDIAWGEKREVGRIGLVVQDHVCRELIEELVKELKSCSIIQPLPLEACKRKLCF